MRMRMRFAFRKITFQQALQAVIVHNRSHVSNELKRKIASHNAFRMGLGVVFS